MLSKLQLTLLCLVPLPLVAQVQAGDPTGTFHTIVDRELDPPPLTSAGSIYLQDSLDLDGDNLHDIRFTVGQSSMPDAIGRSIMLELLHADVAIAASGNNGHAVRRLNAGTHIDAALTWRAFSPDGFPSNSLFIGALGSGFGGPFIYGAEEWLANGPVDTEGYVGVRIGEGPQARYGWIGLVSHVAHDSVRLLIIDTAIQDGSTAIMEDAPLDRIIVRSLPDGKVQLLGPLNEVQRTVVHDASGRVVRTVDGPAPGMIDLAGEARGIHLLTLTGPSGRRAIRLFQ